MTARAVFVLLAAAVVLAGHVTGPFTAPVAVGVLVAGRVGARLEWGVGR